MEISVAAVICAAGSSSRMGGKKKEYMLLPSPPDFHSQSPLSVLGAAVCAFASCPRIGPIVITVPPDLENGEAAARASLPPELFTGDEHPRVFFVPGGHTRRASVHKALSFLDASAGSRVSYVLIHDGARPWIKQTLIKSVIEAVIEHGAVIPALPLAETPKELSSELSSGSIEPGGARFIQRHLRRAQLCTAQTPQGFKFPEILQAHQKAAEREAREHFEYTDDAEVWGEFIGRVAVIAGDSGNRKITFPEDLEYRHG